MNVMTSVPQSPWISLLIMRPLGGAVLCLLHGKRPADCRGLALATALATFGVALYLFVCHGQGSGRWLLYEDVSWIPAYGIRYALAMDGIALLMVLLTAFMQIAAILKWR